MRRTVKPKLPTGNKIAFINEKGQEVLDPTPVEMPLGYNRPENLVDKIRRLIKTETLYGAKKYDRETFDEADDFDIGDEYDPHSVHELTDDQELEPRFTPEQIDSEMAKIKAKWHSLKDLKNDGKSSGSDLGDSKCDSSGNNCVDAKEKEAEKEET